MVLTETIFFSDKHQLLRVRVVGTKIFNLAFEKNPLLVPNGANVTEDVKDKLIAYNVTPSAAKHLACPSFEDQ